MVPDSSFESARTGQLRASAGPVEITTDRPQFDLQPFPVLLLSDIPAVDGGCMRGPQDVGEDRTGGRVCGARGATSRDTEALKRGAVERRVLYKQLYLFQSCSQAGAPDRTNNKSPLLGWLAAARGPERVRRAGVNSEVLTPHPLSVP